MELLITIVVIIAVIAGWMYIKAPSPSPQKASAVYSYKRKEHLMTTAEQAFYKRLVAIAGDRYYVFPQIHLSALLTNDTKGRYWKAAFQRINRTSVDYVLADKTTLQAVYAVELDDSTHDTAKRQARDKGVEQMLTSVDIPLLRFRNVGHLSDEDIAVKFYAVAHGSAEHLGE